MFEVAVWASDGSEHCFSFTEREENALSVRKPRSTRGTFQRWPRCPGEG